MKIWFPRYIYQIYQKKTKVIFYKVRTDLSDAYIGPCQTFES